MTHGLSKVVDGLRRVVLGEFTNATDGQLLECFLRSQDGAAFEELMRRHGSMVLGVCQRVLKNSHDAEDAFQATFLVLIRKAASLESRPNVGNWLYGVAFHTALKARASALNRRVKELQAKTLPFSDEDEQWPDLRGVLDTELACLPETYRDAIVLCDLEELPRKEAAQRLGWPEGTLSGRLSRARELLRKRLTRRGFVVSGGLLAAVISQQAATASVPMPLLVSTAKAAASVAAGNAVTAGVVSAEVAHLTHGVLKTMLLTKLKIASVVLLGVTLFTLATIALSPGSAQQDQSPNGQGSRVKAAGFEGALVAANAAQEKQKKDAGDPNQKDDGQQNQKDDGQQNQKDDGQQNQKDDGDPKKKNEPNKKIQSARGQVVRVSQPVSSSPGVAYHSRFDLVAVNAAQEKQKKDDGQPNQKEDGQQNQKDDGQQNQKDDGPKNQKDDGDQNQKNDPAKKIQAAQRPLNEASTRLALTHMVRGSIADANRRD